MQDRPLGSGTQGRTSGAGARPSRRRRVAAAALCAVLVLAAGAWMGASRAGWLSREVGAVRAGWLSRDVGAVRAGWLSRDVAAARAYREVERARAERYRARVAAGEVAAVPERPRPRVATAPDRAHSARADAPRASRWGRARARAEHLRDETIPNVRRWLAATAELIDDVVETTER